MSGKASPTALRTTVECPHCGFKQLESPHAKSTFCRKCSNHYGLEKPEPPPREARPSFLARLGALLGRKKTREIRCFHCEGRQTVSTSATSSLCPHCSTYIDLTNFKIKTAFSRSLETQGVVHVTAKGDLTSTRVACGEAYIQGKMRGTLVCTGEARIKLKGKLHGALEVAQLIVEKRSDVEAVRPIHAESAQISGKISARLHVDGTVTIKKKGWLEGTVYAKGIVVEKGGIFLGELVIGQRELSQPDLLPLDPLDPPPPSKDGHEPTGGEPADENADDGGPMLKFGVG